MAYDQELANRALRAFETLHPFIDKKMFGGMGIMVNGNMCVGVVKDSLVVRVGKDDYHSTLNEDGVSPFDFTGKPLTGWVYVDGSVIADHESLNRWLMTALDFVLTLPDKH